MSAGQAPEAPVNDHVCEVDHETGSGPDPSGAMVVTEWCACGERMGSYRDRVL